MSIINQFSKHLFWDVDRAKIDLQTHSAYVVQRVLEYGVMKDWKLLCSIWNIDEIAAIARELRSLDDVSLNFIATISNTPKENFRCYQWNFLHNIHCISTPRILKTNTLQTNTPAIPPTKKIPNFTP